MLQRLFGNVTDKEKTEAVKSLFEHAAPSDDFFLMVALSVIMAALGLLLDSPSVVVGSMLIAPILYPILGIAMGITMSDESLVGKSFMTLLKAALLAIALSFLISILFASQVSTFQNDLIVRMQPSLLWAAVAAVAGLAASFAMVKPRLTDTLPGVAISVALIPPLAAIGIGISQMDETMLMSALLLFLINAAGIVFMAAIVFSFMNFYVKRAAAKQVVKQEEKKIEEEKEHAEAKPAAA